MVRTSRCRSGYSLTELMMVVAIVGVIASSAPIVLRQVNRFFLMTQARATLQREARAAIDLATRNIRQARASTMMLDRHASNQPYYSRLTFTTAQGEAVRIWQNGAQLWLQRGNTRSLLSAHLRYLAFAFPRSDDMTIVSVSMTLEHATFQGQIKALHVASEKARVMNP